MMKEIILGRIRDLTAIDVQHKSSAELLASPAEELGELARELKILMKTFGNAHKKTDEGPKAEAVDLFVSATCMWFDPSIGNRLSFEDLINRIQIKDTFPNFSIWEEFEDACVNLGCCSSTTSTFLAQNAINIFFKCGGSEEEFIETANKKLDKWEKTQVKNR